MTTAMRQLVCLLVAGLAGTSLAQPAKPAPKKTGAAAKEPASVDLGPDAPTKIDYEAEIADPTATEGLAPAHIATTLRASEEAVAPQ